VEAQAGNKVVVETAVVKAEAVKEIEAKEEA
jgi:hypothetical protein